MTKVTVMAAKQKGGREDDGCDENDDSDGRKDDGDDVNMTARKQ